MNRIFNSTIQGINSIKFLFLKYGQECYIGERINQLEHALQTVRFGMNLKANDQSLSSKNFYRASLLHDIGQFVALNRQKKDRIGQFVALDRQKKDRIGQFVALDRQKKDRIGQFVALDHLDHKNQFVALDHQTQKKKNQNIFKFNHLGVLHHEHIGANFIGDLVASDGTRLFHPDVEKLIRFHVLAKRYMVTTNPSYYSNLTDASLETLNQQGGLLTRKQLHKFENHHLFKDAIHLRLADDQAKNEKLAFHNWSDAEKIIDKILMN